MFFSCRCFILLYRLHFLKHPCFQNVFRRHFGDPNNLLNLASCTEKYSQLYWSIHYSCTKKVDFFNLSIKKEYNLKIFIMIVYVETFSLHCFILLLTTFLTLIFCQNFIIINVIRYSCQNPFAATRPSLKEYGVIASFTGLNDQTNKSIFLSRK